MYDTLEKERRLIVGSSGTGHNGGGEQEPPESTTHEPQPSETVHIHYFPDAIVICTEEAEAQVVDSTPGVSRKTSVVPAYVICCCYVLLIVAVLVFQVYCLVNPPIATVTIVPKSQTLTLTGTLQLGRLLHPLTVSQSQTVPTTGKGHQSARAATGFLTFYNGQFTSQTVAAGTVLIGVSGVQIVTDQEAHIPAGNPPSYGHVTVSAHAINPGVTGNIPGYDINQACCANAVLAKNTQPFRGGAAERNFQTVAPSDSATIVATLTKSLAQAVSGALQGQRTPLEQLQLLPCTPTVTSDHRIGQEAATVTVSVSETCSAVAYNKAEVDRKATDLLIHQAGTQAGTAYSPFRNIQVRVTRAAISHPPHPLVFLSFDASGTWIYALAQRTQQQIKTRIAGKTIPVALQLLVSLPGVERASLRFAGFGDAARLPKNTQYIHFVLLIV